MEVVVGSTEDLPDLVVKHWLVVTEDMAFVDYIEVEEVVLYGEETLSCGILA